MSAFRTGTRIKLGLIVAAVAIAVASLAFTSRLADRLEAQDEAAVELWARAMEYQVRASQTDVAAADAAEILLEALDAARDLPPLVRDSLRRAIHRAADAQVGGLDFVFSEIIEPARFSVPAVLTDSARTAVVFARNVDERLSEADLLALTRRMNAFHEPLVIRIAPGLVQTVHYGESPLARLIRLFPLVQLGVVGLFVLVGYLGFSYVRRSEQSNLWVGMAKEAAHQLGTPLSSIIGWTELLRLGADGPAPAKVADELEHDVERLRRVADRFEQIGSRPALVVSPIEPVIANVADYIRRRVPTSAPVEIAVEVEPGLAAPLNAKLFEWVVENLLKNALDALEGVPPPVGGHRIDISAVPEGGRVVVRVRDTGKGMDRATARNVFRPGFTTKRRGWGLGLSLARRIVTEYHGGQIAVEQTRPGAGTTFRIALDASMEAV